MSAIAVDPISRLAYFDKYYADNRNDYFGYDDDYIDLEHGGGFGRVRKPKLKINSTSRNKPRLNPRKPGPNLRKRGDINLRKNTELVHLDW